MTWALIFCLLLLVLIGFQLALAFGAPLGRFAWGGQHEGALPQRLRISSALSTLVYLALGLVALTRVGVVALFPAGVAQVMAWVVFGYLCLGVVMNALSRSKGERLLMTPLAAALAASALGVALS